MRWSVPRAARPGWLLLAGGLAGLVVGGIWTLAQPDRFRAETRVLLQGATRDQTLPAVAALAESSILEANVAQTLRLRHRPSVSAKPEAGGLLTLSAEASTVEGARQVDAEAAQVLVNLVSARFGSALEATVVDPGHVVGRTSPTVGRNLVIAGSLGLLLGAAGAVLRFRRLGVAATPNSADPAVERRLAKRIEQITARERKLARQAGELAARERALDDRGREQEGRLADRETQVATRMLELEHLEEQLEASQGEMEVARAEREAQTQPAPEIQAPDYPSLPEMPLPPHQDETGWSLEKIEEVAHRSAADDPTRSEELSNYLLYLRAHADAAGRLPHRFDALIFEVFGLRPEDSWL